MKSPADEKSDHANGPHFRLWAIVICAIFLVLFVLLRARTHFLGDGYLMLSLMEQNRTIGRFWSEIGDQARLALFHLLSGDLKSRALLAYQLVAYASGAGSLAVFALLAYHLARGLLLRLLLFVTFATGGYALMFFGYVETYPPFVFAWALYLLFALLIVNRKLAAWWICLPLIVALAFHIFALAMVPAVVLLLLHRSPLARWYEKLSSKTRVSWFIGIMFGGIAVAVWVYTKSLFVRYALMPPYVNEVTVDNYTLLSPAHIADIINLAFVLVPGLLVAVVAIWRTRNKPTGDLFSRLTGVTTLFAALIVISFHPNLGMPRDWDLYSFVGLPFVGWLARLLTLRPSVNPVRILALISLLGGLVLFPRVAAMAIPDVAIAHFRSYANLDHEKNRSGLYILIKYLRENGQPAEALEIDNSMYRTYPALALQREAMKLRQEGKYELAIAKYNEAMTHDHRWPDVYTGLARSYLAIDQSDSALKYATIANGLSPGNAATLHTLGVTYAKKREFDRARVYLLESRAIDDTSTVIGADLTMVYFGLGDTASAMNEVRQLASNARTQQLFFVQLTDQLLRRGFRAQANEVWGYALKSGSDTPDVQTMRAKYPQLP